MENREQIVADYLKLRVVLNKSNPQKNQKTEIEFLIAHLPEGKLSLRATVKGVLRPGLLEVCNKVEQGRWQPTFRSDLDDLENFCADFLNLKEIEKKGAVDLGQCLLDLKATLGSLGIPRKDKS